MVRSMISSSHLPVLYDVLLKLLFLSGYFNVINHHWFMIGWRDFRGLVSRQWEMPSGCHLLTGYTHSQIQQSDHLEIHISGILTPCETQIIFNNNYNNNIMCNYFRGRFIVQIFIQIQLYIFCTLIDISTSVLNNYFIWTEDIFQSFNLMIILIFINLRYV